MTAETPPIQFDAGSFRDPDTRVFRYNGAVFRCLTARAHADWTRLAATEFHARFMADRRVIPTRLVTDPESLPPLAARWAAVLEHERVPVVSYPYEWSFGMLKDAALLQLDVTRAALDEEMTLKDATAFNVQWFGAHPTFIDTGSFTPYIAGEPWAGYRQFCETFLYPLLLQAYRHVPFHPWLRGSLEGITAEHCLSLLSGRRLLRPGVLTHVYLQAKAQARYEDATGDVRQELRAAGFGAALIKHNIDRHAANRRAAALGASGDRPGRSISGNIPTYDADLRRKTEFVEQITGRAALAPRLGPRLQHRQLFPAWPRSTRTTSWRWTATMSSSSVCTTRSRPAGRRTYCRSWRTWPIRRRVWAGVAGSACRSATAARRRSFMCLALMHHLVIGRNIPLDDFVAWLAQFGAEVVLEFVAPGRPDGGATTPQPAGSGVRLFRRRAVGAALGRHFGAVTHETLASGTRTLYHCQPATR